MRYGWTFLILVVLLTSNGFASESPERLFDETYAWALSSKGLALDSDGAMAFSNQMLEMGSAAFARYREDYAFLTSPARRLPPAEAAKQAWKLLNHPASNRGKMYLAKN